jgi:hypothetical protein
MDSEDPMPGNEDAVAREEGTLELRRGFGSSSAGVGLSVAAIAAAGVTFAFAVSGVFPDSGSEYKIQADAFTPPSRPRVETAGLGQSAESDDCAGQAWPHFSEACIISNGRVAAKASATIPAPPTQRAAIPSVNPQLAVAPAQPGEFVSRVAAAAPAAPLPPAGRAEVETTGGAAAPARVPLPAPRTAPAQRGEAQPPPQKSATLAEEGSPSAVTKPQPKKHAKAKPRRRALEDDNNLWFERRTKRSYDRVDRDYNLRDLDRRGSRDSPIVGRGDGNDDERPRRRRVIVIERGSDDFFGQLFRF